MVGAIVIEITDQYKQEGLGKHHFAVLPRAGDFIELEGTGKDGKAIYCEVITVCLASETTSDAVDEQEAADVFVWRVGERGEFSDWVMGKLTKRFNG